MTRADGEGTDKRRWLIGSVLVPIAVALIGIQQCRDRRKAETHVETHGPASPAVVASDKVDIEINVTERKEK